MTLTPNPLPPRHPDWRAEVVDLGRTVAFGLAGALVLHAALFQPFTIPSSSMEPGLVTGDYIVVSKFAYGWSLASPSIRLPLASGRLLGRDPARGDVVVFRLPRDPAQIWIKRVIGLPGDRVQVSGGHIRVNGQWLSQTPLAPVRDHDRPERIVVPTLERQQTGRTYLTYDGGPGFPGDDTEVIIVPAGTYLVMGDNRDNSLDGRFPRETGVGLLPAGNLLGRAEVIVASWKPGASLFKPWTWPNLQPDRFWRRIV